jgi:tRNA1(Val) A37 N6-methylase TrmN6
MERWEWLIEPKTGIFQDPDLGCFTEDSIALVHFARIGRSDAVLDLGTGNGILCLYAEARYGGTYTGVDVDERQLALARASAERNGQAIRFPALSATDAPGEFGHGSFTRVLMNPPYFTAGEPGKHGTARHAADTLLTDWCASAFLVLKNGGTLTFCYPAEQLAAAFRALDRTRFAPKRLKLEMSGPRARLALIEARKLGADGLTVTVGPDKKRKPDTDGSNGVLL